jgi:cation diffusion facilitator family transporter
MGSTLNDTAVHSGALPVAQAAALTRRVTTLSVSVAIVLVVAKLITWLASGSVALLASLADSGLDVLASSATFLAVRYAAVPPDREHRYGHGKAEAFASLLQAGLVFASAALIGQEAISHILKPTPIADQSWAMAVMVLSGVMTLALVRAQTVMLKTAQSVAVSGDRVHYLADLGSNVVALIGIGLAAWLNEPRIDAAAGLLVAAGLVWGAIQVFRDSSHQLMDHELSDEARAEIVARMTSDPKVRGVHQLRTRASGPYVHIQMHADLDPELSLEQAHGVLVAAENRVLESFPAADIIIHPDPEDRAEAHGGAFAGGDQHHAAPSAAKPA